MKLLRALLLCLSLSCAPLLAQEPFKDLFAAGGSWNTQGSPQVNGMTLYAHQLGTGLYSFTLTDITPVQLRPRVVITTNMTTGLAQHLRNFAFARIYVLATAGVGAGGENVGFAYSAGGAAVIPLGKSGLCLLPNIRVLKNTLSEFQGIYGLALGFGQ